MLQDLGQRSAKRGHAPYKYVANRFLTFVQNLLLGSTLSEFHTGYRAFSSEVLRDIPYECNSDDFVFENELLSQIIFEGHEIAEITTPTKYLEEASTINFKRSAQYGLGVLRVSLMHFLAKRGF